MNTTVLTVGGIITLGVGAGAAFLYYKKRKLDTFFAQICEETKQVPKQKKNSFLLLMFKESVLASSKKSNSSSFANKLQNPKFLNVHLIQMATILKDPSNVKDKNMKKALNLYKGYQAWETAKWKKAKAEKEKLEKTQLVADKK